MSSLTSNVNTQTIVFVGDTNTGKTSFARQLLTNEYPNKHIPTMGFEMFPIQTLNSSYRILDTAGKDSLGGLRDGYYINANFIFIFLTTKTLNSFYYWFHSTYDICKDKAKYRIILSKSDLNTEKNEETIATFCFRVNIPMFQITTEDLKQDGILEEIIQGRSIM